MGSARKPSPNYMGSARKPYPNSRACLRKPYPISLGPIRYRVSELHGLRAKSKSEFLGILPQTLS
eukprot:8920447-Pyramimonas_sp.AAC.1